ncbi:hypothetical protein [Inquilinus sp.]|jgi:hypothetical protein|uniref:hypothetical protein n=1 Tax=Inquilinus sp. TaxID=1932117 RepID=UPI0037844DDB
MDGNRLGLFELVERDAWLDLYAAAPRDLADTLRIGSHRIGEIGLLAAAGLPSVEFNRAIFPPVGTPLAGRELDQATAWLTANAAPGWGLQIGPVARNRAVDDWLDAHAMAPSGLGWARFHRTADDGMPVPAPDATIQAHLVEDAQGARIFGEVVRLGFGFPPAIEPWFAALFGRPGWRLYVGTHGERPVAAGASFAKHGVAWLGIDTTLADHRRRGAQTAMIARRVEDGRAMGLSGLTAETGQPNPGREAEHTSYSNYRRAGFTPAYARPNYKPAQPAPPASA